MNKTYKLKLTGGETITMDQEDFDKVAPHIGTKTFIKVKEAIFNTAYIVSITPEMTFEDGPRVDRKREFDGYIDESKKVFVVTKDKIVETVIERPSFK